MKTLFSNEIHIFQGHAAPVYRTTSKESSSRGITVHTIEMSTTLFNFRLPLSYLWRHPYNVQLVKQTGVCFIDSIYGQRRVPIPRKGRASLVITIPCNCWNIFSLLQELTLTDWNQRSILIHLDLLRPGRVSHRTYSCRLCPGLQGYIR